MKITTRLSKPNVPIVRLLKSNHQLTGPVTNWAGITGSELYYGIVYAGTPEWLGFLTAGTNSVISNLSNQGAAALIFIPVNNRYMIFSFGYANSKLSSYGLERDFGIRVVLNSIDPTKVKSIDSKILGTVVMNRRTQLSKDKRIEDFGFEINKDFLKHIAGKPSSNSFASMISGSDSLNINCDISATTIVQKVNDIYSFYSSTSYQANYSWVDNVKAVKDGLLLPALNTELVNAFNGLLSGNLNELSMASPSIIDYGVADHFKIRGYRSTESFSFIDIEAFIADMRKEGVPSVLLSDLERYRIEAYDSSGNNVGSWTVYDWMIYEVVHNGVQYLYNDGEWFQINNNYYNSVNNDYHNILSNATEYIALAPTTHKNETAYLGAYTVSRNEKLFDRNLAYTYGVTNSIEICDLYNVNREFIHVKEGSSSAKLSHLFNQGFVSASAFLNDLNFRNDVSSKLTSQRNLATTIGSILNPSKYTIVYRILKEGQSLILPFFSKLVLLEMYKKIKNMGYKFRLEWIQKV
jgi:uncharacterized protein (TIGR04141 family)